jgi:hypothetical protein
MARRTVPTASPVYAVRSVMEGTCEVILPSSIWLRSWPARGPPGTAVMVA